MLRVGIVTFWDAINYGASLQLFALEKILALNYNIDAEAIKFKYNELNKKSNWIKKTLEVFKKIFFYRKNNFQKFTERYVKLSDSVESQEELILLGRDYNFIIVGSDQVWNSKLNGMKDFFFANFVSKDKRCSYAASFGVRNIEEQLRKAYIKGLSEFKHISVREKTGSVIINDLLGVQVPVVLDPTLLLNREQWKEQLVVKENTEKYILLYCLRKSNLLLELAKKISKETGLKIKILNPKRRHSIFKDDIAVAGPEEFVNLFYNAECILTNSFHGTAFSINFNKPFLVELWPDVSGNVNSRIEDILESVGLKKQIIQYPYDIEADINRMFDFIDWKIVNSKLDYERKKSFMYLESVMNYEDDFERKV